MTLEEHLRAIAHRVAGCGPELAQLLTDASDAIRRRAEESPGERRIAEMVLAMVAALGADERASAGSQRYTDTDLIAAAEMHGGCRPAGRALGLSHSTVSRAVRRHSAAAEAGDVPNERTSTARADDC
jgi:hypothetical protein